MGESWWWVLQHLRLSELINVWQSRKVFVTAWDSNLQIKAHIFAEIMGLAPSSRLVILGLSLIAWVIRLSEIPNICMYLWWRKNKLQISFLLYCWYAFNYSGVFYAVVQCKSFLILRHVLVRLQFCFFTSVSAGYHERQKVFLQVIKWLEAFAHLLFLRNHFFVFIATNEVGNKLEKRCAATCLFLAWKFC